MRFVLYLVLVFSIALFAQSPTVAQTTAVSNAANSEIFLRRADLRLDAAVTEERLRLALQHSSGDSAPAISSSGVTDQTSGLLKRLLGDAVSLYNDYQLSTLQISNCNTGQVFDDAASAAKGLWSKPSVGTKNTLAIVGGVIPVLYSNCDFNSHSKAVLPSQSSGSSTGPSAIASIGGPEALTPGGQSECDAASKSPDVSTDNGQRSLLISASACFRNEAKPADYSALELAPAPPSLSSTDMLAIANNLKKLIDLAQPKLDAATPATADCRLIQHLVAFDDTIYGMVDTKKVGLRTTLSSISFVLPFVGGCSDKSKSK